VGHCEPPRSALGGCGEGGDPAAGEGAAAASGACAGDAVRSGSDPRNGADVCEGADARSGNAPPDGADRAACDSLRLLFAWLRAALAALELPPLAGPPAVLTAPVVLELLVRAAPAAVSVLATTLAVDSVPVLAAFEPHPALIKLTRATIARVASGRSVLFMVAPWLSKIRVTQARSRQVLGRTRVACCAGVGEMTVVSAASGRRLEVCGPRIEWKLARGPVERVDCR
jgi:hypothetical protein